MRYKVAKSVGLNSDTQAAQVIYNFSDEQNLFIGVLKITGDNAFITGRQLLSDLSSDFTEQEGSAGEKLSKAYDTAKNTLADVEFDILLGAVSAKVLYLIGKGQVAVSLKREDRIAPLLSKGNEQLISGFLKEGDKILFSTQALTALLKDNLTQNLSLGTEEWEDELTGLLSNHEENDGLAAALLDIEPEPILTENPKEESSESDDILPLGSSQDNLQENLNKPKKFLQALILSPFKLKNITKIVPRNGKIRLIIAVILLLIIASFAGFQYWSGRQNQNQKESAELLTQARSVYNQAQGLVLLNPIEAQAKFKESTNLVNQSLSKNPKNTEAQAFKNEIQQGSNTQNAANSASSELVNLDTVQKDFKGSKLNLHGNTLLTLDTLKNILISTSLDKKESKVLAEEPEIGNAEAMNLTDQAIFIYSEDKGLLRLDLGNQKVSTLVKTDSGWGSITGFATFGTNLYLLDNDNNQIWKYLPTTSGYSDKRDYLAGNTEGDFGTANDLQIDSSVYVLKGGDTIEKFTKGTTDNFSITGLDKPLSDAKAIYVTDETDNLYVLDSGNSRLVILSKSGSFVAQYQGDKFSVASDLAVDEKAKKVYLIDGSKIYQTEIK